LSSIHKIIVLLIILFVSISGYCGDKVSFMNKSKQQGKVIDVNVSLKYLLYLPPGYDEKGKPWPLIIFLHGRGQRGNDLEKVKVNGIPEMIENKKYFPFVIISPQCPEKANWVDCAMLLKTMIDCIKSKYNVDASRIYLTGISMGGFGTWYMAERYPEEFAAIAPICGGGDPKFAKDLNMAIWVFHGAKDNAVPIQRSQEMVDAVKAAGGDVKFTIYPELGHDCWNAAYENEELYKWFLSHKTNKK
jgi:predicted peptidase